jgi:hypothetical protein
MQSLLLRRRSLLSSAGKPEWTEEVMKGFKTRLDKVSDRVSQVTAETDEKICRTRISLLPRS